MGVKMLEHERGGGGRMALTLPLSLPLSLWVTLLWLASSCSVPLFKVLERVPGGPW